ncbi:MAG: hypothetical protein FWD73_15370 [Polyangiaceae bacterium]|nr:hypothetical protein [Polyangiaceae bacterium]
MDLSSDLIDLLEAFAKANVEYLIIGGQAVALHGWPRFTKDIDIWLRDSTDNMAKAVGALHEFGAPEATIDGLIRATGLDVAWMGVPPNRFDLMKSVPGGDFERAWQSRTVLDVAGVRVSVVSRDELIRLKRISGRPQDLVDADKLGRL